MADAAVHKAVYLGDTDGDATYLAFDAQIVLAWSSISIWDSTPTIGPIHSLVGDPTGDGDLFGPG